MFGGLAAQREEEEQGWAGRTGESGFRGSISGLVLTQIVTLGESFASLVSSLVETPVKHPGPPPSPEKAGRRSTSYILGAGLQGVTERLSGHLDMGWGCLS